MKNSYLFEVTQQVIANEVRTLDIVANTAEEALEIFEQNKAAIKDGSFTDCEMIKTDNSIQFKYHPTIQEVEYNIESETYLPDATFSVTMETDNEEDTLSRYTHREGVDITQLLQNKVFSVDDMLIVLNNMQRSLNPHLYKSSENLDPSDYLDLALCEASRLGIEEEFKSYYKTDSNYIGWKKQ